jgi:leader peptidase (prepilin peptidase)/N-methyltransferase
LVKNWQLVAVALVTFATAATVAILTLHAINAAFGTILAALALYVAAVDLDRFEIPDTGSVAILIFGLAWTIATFGFDADAFVVVFARAAATAGLLLAVRAVYETVRGIEGLGLGDVKLAGAGAVWVCWSHMLTALTLAVAAALIVVVGRCVIAKERIRGHIAVPFGTFLAPAIWLAWYAQVYGLLSMTWAVTSFQ